MNFVPAINLLTEFGCGYVLLGCHSRLLHSLGMVLMSTFCFKVLRFGWRCKGSIRFLCDSGGIPKFGLCLHNVVRQVPNPKVVPFEKKRDPVNASPSIKPGSNVSREGVNNAANSEDGSKGKDEIEREFRDEDEVFNVITLRKLVKVERQKANAACAELEEERTAACSSAEEAMAMILRLQNEKSAAEIQANQFHRMAEEKLEYDQEVIESLEWTITQRESQRSVLEDQLGIYRKELKQYMSQDELDLLEVDDRGRGSFGCDPNDHVASNPETESQRGMGSSRCDPNDLVASNPETKSQTGMGSSRCDLNDPVVSNPETESQKGRGSSGCDPNGLVTSNPETESQRSMDSSGCDPNDHVSGNCNSETESQTGMDSCGCDPNDLVASIPETESQTGRVSSGCDPNDLVANNPEIESETSMGSSGCDPSDPVASNPETESETGMGSSRCDPNDHVASNPEIVTKRSGGSSGCDSNDPVASNFETESQT